MSLLPLAPDGVFETIQGEGVLLGIPMVFVRFAGCPVNCPECDTDYSVRERATALAIASRVCAAASSRTEWVFLTGGEPLAYDLRELRENLYRLGFKVACATSGRIAAIPQMFDFLSVSPHELDNRWKQRIGDQVNIVPGLNGLRLADVDNANFGGFSEKFVTPLSGDPENVAECREFVIRAGSGWRLGVQAHLFWRLK